jgi:hypothetical protein
MDATVAAYYMNGTKVKVTISTHHLPRLLVIEGWFEQV